MNYQLSHTFKTAALQFPFCSVKRRDFLQWRSEWNKTISSIIFTTIVSLAALIWSSALILAIFTFILEDRCATGNIVGLTACATELADNALQIEIPGFRLHEARKCLANLFFLVENYFYQRVLLEELKLVENMWIYFAFGMSISNLLKSLFIKIVSTTFIYLKKNSGH